MRLALALLLTVAVSSAFPPAAKAVSPCSWSGVWDTSLVGRPFVLTVPGNQGPSSFAPSGVYGHLGPDNTFLAGLQWDGGMVGTIPRSLVGGDKINIRMTASCDAFTGTVGPSEAPTALHDSWTGTRITADDRTLMVIDAYRRNLCRDPETAGRLYWTGTGADRPAIEAELRRTGEWERLQPVRNLYLNTLARDPLLGDCYALNRWIDSGLPLAEVERQLAESEEGRWVRAVRDLYIELLGRDPIPDDQAGVRSWNRADLDRIRAAIMRSAEYRQRQQRGTG